MTYTLTFADTMHGIEYTKELTSEWLFMWLGHLADNPDFTLVGFRLLSGA